METATAENISIGFEKYGSGVWRTVDLSSVEVYVGWQACNFGIADVGTVEVAQDVCDDDQGHDVQVHFADQFLLDFGVDYIVGAAHFDWGGSNGVDDVLEGLGLEFRHAG